MRRRGDRIPGRRGYGGVLLVPCLLHAAYRYWLLADTGAARTLITPDVAFELGLDLRVRRCARNGLRRCTTWYQPRLYASRACR